MMRRRHERIALAAALFLFLGMTQAFLSPVPPNRRNFHQLNYKLTDRMLPASAEEDLLASIRSMKVPEIQKQLMKLQTPIDDVFEKDELVRRLFEALQARRDHALAKSVEGPLFLTNYAQGGFVTHPTDPACAVIQVQVHDGPQDYTLSLLLDTAASADIVVRPEVSRKYNMKSSYTPPVSVSSAAKRQAVSSKAQITSLSFGGQQFGPTAAKVQVISALPPYLDGIIGLSFFNQFPCVQLDFEKGILTLFKEHPEEPLNLEVKAEARMEMVPGLGLSTANVWLDNKGPVSMLVDTGAPNTFLNWKGLGDLGICRNSAKVSMIPELQNQVNTHLTHRCSFGENLNLGLRQQGGVSVEQEWMVDIGQFPVVQGLTRIGGILGLDALMKCPVVRFSCHEPRRMTMYGY